MAQATITYVDWKEKKKKKQNLEIESSVLRGRHSEDLNHRTQYLRKCWGTVLKSQGGEPGYIGVFATEAK